MTGAWWIVIAASVLVYLLKLSGYLIPQRLSAGPAVSRIAALVTIGLLSSLVASQTLAASGELSVDARVPAILVAAGLLWLRAPFIVVIVAAAAVAAGLRAFGLMA